MGNHPHIGHQRFPKQSNNLWRRVVVCFHYDLTNLIGGVIVRDDLEDPYQVIIRLDDGRHVLTTECQYRIP